MTVPTHSAPPDGSETTVSVRAQAIARDAGRPSLEGVRATVVGLGRSGIAAARFLSDRGARVVANDRRTGGELPRTLADDLGAGVDLALGGHPTTAFAAADLVVVSPGVPPLPEVAARDAAGVPVWGELELASRFIDAPIVAITGTNGKSTVTSLVGEIAAAAGRPTFVGGNLGTPLLEAVDHPAASRPDGLVVVEASSFQLERVVAFRPRVAALLNVTEDHLDRYPSFAAYAAAKARIFHAQGPDDVAVVPANDPLVRSIARGGRGHLRTFGGEAGDVRVVPGSSGHRIRSSDGRLDVSLSSLRLAGRHNVDNACAAAAISLAAGLPASAIAAGLARFPGLPHRMAHVAEVDGVTFYDDSKATNVGAALAALEGLDADPRREGRVVLMLGGVDKGGSYLALRERVERGAHRVVVFGAAAPRILEAFEGSSAAVVAAEDFPTAFSEAVAAASPGDAVLLAPACSSFDMFASFAERGDAFVRLVRAHASRRGVPGGGGR